MTGRGLPAAFEDVVVLHSIALHGYLARRVPSAADDLLSEVWLAAYAGRHRYDPELGSVRAWLFGVARNVMFAHLRRVEPTPRAGPEPVEDVWDAVVARLDAAAVAPRLQSALAALPAIERELLLLVAWEQLSPAEAAQVVGVPAGTARSRLHRARIRLRDQLDGDLAADRGAADRGEDR